MPFRSTPRSARAFRRSRRLAPVGATALTALAVAPPLIAQDIGDAARLAGVTEVGTRATAAWDEEITMSAGGATGAQFEQALGMGFRDAIDGADGGPALRDDAPAYVTCHVDTFYDRALIVYAVRVSYHRPDAEGLPIVAWLRSWVGSYTTQQLHVMWSLADQCADTFLDAWREANG